MPSTHDQVFNLDDELDALVTPTTLEVLAHSQDYDADIVAAAAARRAINGVAGPGATAAEDVSFTPAGNLSSTDVQAAIEELDAEIVSAVADLVASAPGALDTLDELAAALGDDANFATTVTNALAGKQPLDSDLTAIAALATTAFGRGLLELADQAALLAAAGAVSSARTITAGSGLGGGGDLTADRTLDVNVDDSTLEISSDALRLKAAGILASHIGDAELAALAGLTSAADKGIQFTGSGTAGTYDLTTAGKALLDDADAAAQRATLGLGALATLSAISSSEITDGSIVNADVSGSAAIAYSKLNLAASIVAGDFSDAEIAALAGLTSAANKGIQFTGSGTAATYDLTTAGKALLDDADAAAQRTTLGLGTAATSAATDFVPQTLADAKGDMIAASAADTWAKLTVGSNITTRLIADSSASTGLSWVPHVVRRSADTAARNSGNTGNTLTNDDATGGTLKWALAASEVWYFQAWLLLSGANQTMKSKFGWSVPSGCTMQWGLGSAGNNAGSTGFGAWSSTAPGAVLSESGSQAVNSGSNVVYGVPLAGMVVNGANAGDITLQWAQQTSDASNLVLKANSILLVWRLA